MVRTAERGIRLELLKINPEAEREFSFVVSAIQMLVRLDFYMIPLEVIGDYLSEIMAMSGFKIVKPLSMDDTRKKANQEE